jgi:crotonobetainyl-CoA:carnitine CoA-transferase CaiB-like acyl-CoA transferase
VQDRIDAMHALQRAGVPASAVMTTEDIASDANFLARDAFQVVPLPGGESIRLMRAGWAAKRAAIEIGRGPEYSEHTEVILRERLGMTDAEIAKMAESGAIVMPVKAEELV